MWLGLAACGQAAENHTFPPELADHLAQLDSAWDEARPALLQGSGQDALEGLLRRQNQAGIRGRPAAAAALIRMAVELSDQGQADRAALLLDWSYFMAPDRAEMDLARARYWLRSKTFSPNLAGDEMRRFFRHLSRDFRVGLRLAGWGLWTVMNGLLACLWALAAILFFRYLRTAAHDLSHLFPAESLPDRAALLLVGAVPLLPLAFGLPWWTIPLAGLVLFSFYSRLSERLAALALCLALAGLPSLHATYAKILAASADPVINAVLRLQEGVYFEEDVAALGELSGADAESPEVLLTLAALHQRRGELSEAGQVFQRLLETPAARQADCRAVIHNNLGGLWLAAEDLEQAAAYFREAAQSVPLPVEAAYNLSQTSHGLLDTKEGDAWNAKAAALDPDLVDVWGRTTRDLPLAQRVVDMPVPAGLLWQRTQAGGERARAVEAATWEEWMGLASPATVRLVFFAAALAVLLALSVSGGLQLSEPCAACGQPVCSRCHRLSKDPDLCSPCYHVFRSQSGMDPRVRQERKALANHFQDRRRQAGLLATAAMPGAGHLLQGSTAIGAAFLLPAGLLWAAVLGPAGVWRPDDPVFNDILLPAAAAAGGYLLLAVPAAVLYAVRYRH